MLARGLTISEISFDMDWWNRGILFLSAFHHSRSGESINARCQPWRLLRGYFTCSLKRWSQADTTPGDKNMGCKWLLTHIVAGSLRLNGFWLVLTTSNQFINGIQWVHEAITKQRWFHVSPKMGGGNPILSWCIPPGGSSGKIIKRPRFSAMFDDEQRASHSIYNHYKNVS